MTGKKRSTKIPGALDTRHAEASQPASCAHPYTHAEEVIGEEVGVIRESYTVCSKCGERISPKVQSTPETTMQPWMEAAARCARIAEHHCRLVSKGQASDVTEATFAYAIAAHAPAPAVRDAAVEELVRAAESAEMWLQKSIPVGGMPMLRAAIARVRAEKGE